MHYYYTLLRPLRGPTRQMGATAAPRRPQRARGALAHSAGPLPIAPPAHTGPSAGPSAGPSGVAPHVAPTVPAPFPGNEFR